MLHAGETTWYSGKQHECLSKKTTDFRVYITPPPPPRFQGWSDGRKYFAYIPQRLPPPPEVSLVRLWASLWKGKLISHAYYPNSCSLTSLTIACTLVGSKSEWRRISETFMTANRLACSDCDCSATGFSRDFGFGSCSVVWRISVSGRRKPVLRHRILYTKCLKADWWKA